MGNFSFFFPSISLKILARTLGYACVFRLIEEKNNSKILPIHNYGLVLRLNNSNQFFFFSFRQLLFFSEMSQHLRKRPFKELLLNIANVFFPVILKILSGAILMCIAYFLRLENIFFNQYFYNGSHRIVVWPGLWKFSDNFSDKGLPKPPNYFHNLTFSLGKFNHEVRFIKQNYYFFSTNPIFLVETTIFLVIQFIDSL